MAKYSVTHYIKHGEKAEVTPTAIIHKEEYMYVAECPEVGTVVPMHRELRIGNERRISSFPWESFPSWFEK